MSPTTTPVAMENTAKAMPASRMLPPTFSAKAAYIGTSIDSAKAVRKLILSSRRACLDRELSMETGRGRSEPPRDRVYEASDVIRGLVQRQGQPQAAPSPR